ncbi:MAG TPA: helix-turn-helix domain-containing protein [Baekduia sp.]|nr:helix-turn-helix domain-containing protein [Baekduia sp.]
MSVRAERAEQAARLHAEGLTGIEIAKRLGVSRSYAYELLADPDGSGARERKDRYAQPCVGCGAPTSGGKGMREDPRCQRCAATKAGAERTVWTRDAILAAGQWWIERHGEHPAACDWNSTQARRLGDVPRYERARSLRAAGRIPGHMTVHREFGSWNAFIAALGCEPRAPHGGAGNHLRMRRARTAA